MTTMRHGNFITGIIQAQRQAAGLNLVEWEREFGEYAFSDISTKITARLGGNDRIAKFNREVDSPFGKKIRYLTVPGYMAGDVTGDEIPEIVEDSSGIIVFKFGGIDFIYDRLGLRFHDKSYSALQIVNDGKL